MGFSFDMSNQFLVDASLAAVKVYQMDETSRGSIFARREFLIALHNLLFVDAEFLLW